jgi:tetratricopeptide (TPR) repeat protein
MNPHLMIILVGLCYVVLFGGMSLLRREGLSNQFAFEVLGITALVVVIALLMGTTVHPVLFLIVVYLISMRARLLVDVANLLSGRGRQRDAITVLQWAMNLNPDRSTKLIILVNMGIVQLRRQNPESAQALFESVLEEAKDGGLGIKYEAACRFNLGLALKRQGKEAEAVHQFNETIGTFPGSLYSKAAERELEQRRRIKETKPVEPPDGPEISDLERSARNH